MKRLFVLAFAGALGLAAFTFSGAEAVKPSIEERFSAEAGATAAGETGKYAFDRAHSAIGFRVKHMGLVDVPGYFRDFTGEVSYNAEDVTKSSVAFTAKMTSVDTGVDARDNHLRTKDFFEVETYPEMTFKSTKVEKSGDSLKVTGNLTMKDVTKTITFPVKVTGFLPGNQRNGPRMGAVAETTINRRDFNVNYGGNLPGTNTPTLSDEIKVWLQIEAIKPLDAKPAASQ